MEGLTVSQWVAGVLTADADLQGRVGDRMYEALGPSTAAYPMIVWTVAEAHGVVGVGLSELMSTIPLTVKAIGRGSSYSPLVPIVSRVVELLGARTNQSVGMGLVLTCERTGGIQYPEQLNGIEYRHLGAQFEINAQ